mmetsp:Transcript_23262/g.36106  ORF Transcript_23262/g.36106 Transcript_23262/m.36106 type:complete len:105 (+) Transcript_23262:418-732(+)
MEGGEGRGQVAMKDVRKDAVDGPMETGAGISHERGGERRARREVTGGMRRADGRWCRRRGKLCNISTEQARREAIVEGAADRSMTRVQESAKKEATDGAGWEKW